MKKLFSFLIAGVSISFSSFAQHSYDDDGFVTSHLSVSINQDTVTNYLRAFSNSLEATKTMQFNSEGNVINYLGFEPGNNSKLENLLSQSQSCRDCNVSAGFIEKIIAIKNTNGNDQYPNLNDLRGDLKNIALTSSLSNAEAQSLMLIDLSLQLVSHSYGFYNPEARIPRWLICPLGVIGSAIIGGIGTAGSGATAGGALAGPPGAALGAVVGGILGVIGGAFVGAATFCQ